VELFNVDQVFLGLAIAVITWKFLLHKLNLRQVSREFSLAGTFIFLTVSAIAFGVVFLVANIAWDWSGWIVLPLLAVFVVLSFRDFENHN
jgi:hypothetical protein